MPTHRARVAPAALVGALAATLLAASPAPAAEPQPRRSSNATGVAAGSLPNGTGNLRVRLALTPEGQVKVRWKRPAPASALRRFVVRVGPNRLLDNLVESYRVPRTAQSVTLPPASGVLPDSGSFTFVKVVVHRRSGQVGASPTKWIGAPIQAACTAAPDDRVTVGTFNIRNWLAEERKGNTAYPWPVRAPNVIRQILRSGAHAIAIQEASGPENAGFGPLEQDEYLIRELNAQDPDRDARWTDALPDEAYRNPGGTPGLKGTRVFYDAHQFDKLASGLFRLEVPGLTSDSLMPWARLRARGGASAPFVLTSNHLDQGEDRESWEFRTHQVEQTAQHVLDLYHAFGDQVIVAGDLNETANTNPYNQAHRRLVQLGMFDATATLNTTGVKYPTTNGLDFPVRPTPNRRDYILTYGTVRGSCAYANLAYRTASDVSSDHFMQRATVPLPPH